MSGRSRVPTGPTGMHHLRIREDHRLTTLPLFCTTIEHTHTDRRSRHFNPLSRLLPHAPRLLPRVSYLDRAGGRYSRHSFNIIVTQRDICCGATQSPSGPSKRQALVSIQASQPYTVVPGAKRPYSQNNRTGFRISFFLSSISIPIA